MILSFTHQEAESLVSQKIHPQTVISGWRKAVDAAREALTGAARDNGYEIFSKQIFLALNAMKNVSGSLPRIMLGVLAQNLIDVSYFKHKNLQELSCFSFLNFCKLFRTILLFPCIHMIFLILFFRKDPVKFKEDLLNIARTTLSSKILTQHKEKFSNLAVDAVLRLKVKI